MMVATGEKEKFAGNDIFCVLKLELKIAIKSSCEECHFSVRLQLFFRAGFCLWRRAWRGHAPGCVWLRNWGSYRYRSKWARFQSTSRPIQIWLEIKYIII